MSGENVLTVIFCIIVFIAVFPIVVGAIKEIISAFNTGTGGGRPY